MEVIILSMETNVNMFSELVTSGRTAVEPKVPWGRGCGFDLGSITVLDRAQLKGTPALLQVLRSFRKVTKSEQTSR
jgi:hypothetical protein